MELSFHSQFRLKFWLCFATLSALAGWVSYQYLGTVYSIVNLSISADRQEILQQAEKLAQQLQWDINQYHSVVSFATEHDLQCFVELEAGGKDVFVNMMQSGTYYPYQWRVRFFKEKEIVEMHAWFSPQGKPLGFYKKIAEETPGAALEKEQAQKLIEQSIVNWCPHFEHYALIEYDNEKRETGRVDHVFTYERKDIVIGKGFYRFKAVVCGDEVTRLEPFVKVPDNFLRRYQEMRSANNLLTLIGSFFYKSLYILFLGLIGLIYFYRRKYLYIKWSAFMALGAAGGILLEGLNNYPLWWSSYSTVQSMMVFICTKCGEQAIQFLYLFFMVALLLAIAEAAERFVYKKHAQLSMIFQEKALLSYDVVQQILLGYLIVPFMFLYVVGFGYITKTYFGWWTPAESLTDPNVLASYLPWLAVLPSSFFAGFFEEVAFRVLPLAMTKFVTRNSKYKNVWFVLMFIAQSLIFGACHANYPNQPFYARVIEIFPVSCLLGWLYIQFGLLPGMITHVVYDAVWFAIPVFNSNAWVAQIIIIIASGLPLLLVLYYYLKNRKLSLLQAEYRNEAFQAPEYVPTTIVPRPVGHILPKKYQKIMFVLGLVGLSSWLVFEQLQPDTYPVRITRKDAIEIAKKTVEDKFKVSLGNEWTALAIAQDASSSIQSRFIWQEYGPVIYDLSQGAYLSGSSWLVRFAKFSGPVEERGEEFAVVISSSHVEHHALRQPIDYHQGHVMKVIHTLPEHFAGADISQEQAEALAYQCIDKEFALAQQDLKLISVTSNKFDNRRDWNLVFQDLKVFDFALGGQARIAVKVAGDTVTEFSRFVFVPESWERADQEKKANIVIVKRILGIVLFLLMLLSCIFALMRLMKSQFSFELFKHKTLFFSCVLLLNTINGITAIIAHFSTAEPFQDQFVSVILITLMSVAGQILTVGILLAAAAVSFTRGAENRFTLDIVLAWCAALCIQGVNALVYYFEPTFEPLYVKNYIIAGHWLPTVALVTGSIKFFCLLLSIMISVFMILKFVKKRWAERIDVQFLACFVFFIAYQSMQGHETVIWMLAHGTALAITVLGVYHILLQFNMTLLPLVAGFYTCISMMSELVYPSYMGAQYDAMVAIIMIKAIAILFYRWWRKA